MKLAGLVAAGFLILLLAGYFGLATKAVTVLAFGQDDACGTYAQVAGEPGGRVALKARPTLIGRTIARVDVGTAILLCEEAGRWHGVIVIRDGVACLDRDNGDTPRPYGGPCVSGWLRADQVALIAG